MAIYPGAAASNTNLYVAANNKVTNLTSAIDAVVTTIPVTSTTGFPTSGFISIDLEIIAYTGVTATDFTGATRAADGSTATTHAINSLVSHNIVAAHHNASKDEIIAVETDLVSVQANITPVAAASTATSLLQRLAHVVFQIKAITGTTNWYDTVVTPLTGKASTALDNLAAVAINTSLLPAVDNTINLGSATKRWLQLFIEDIDAGASGTPGTVDIFPNTAAKGKIQILATDSTGDTTTTLTNAAQAGARTYTVPDAGASASFVMTQGTQTISGIKTFDGQLIGKGTTTNDNAATGFIGEEVRSSVTVSADAAATGIFEDITSISLTAGDWDVSGMMYSTINGSTWTGARVAITSSAGDTDTGSLGDNDSLTSWVSSSTTPTAITLSVPAYRFSLSGTTTIYLKARHTFSAGTPQRRGTIRARRVR